ncbi:MAG: DNA/RNA non-specific endonuclease [Oscillibacter sp.]|nr:DNA/RNA non-specific endonuclease [Oscillibacter sp.]
MTKKKTIGLLALLVCLLLSGCEVYQQPHSASMSGIYLDSIPAYSGEPYVALNNNEPTFLEGELTTESYEFYSDLDSLGRCGTALACVGVDLMPTEERGSIGQVKPTGWQTVKYDCVDGKYLYNRCHLIGYQLSGENANKQNLITGTRYLNVDGMLPFENMVADYVKETENHVLYRVMPVFEGDNLVASGVVMEAKSVEDNGEGVSYNVYVYNVQPGVEIDYATGLSWLEGTSPDTSSGEQEITYILNVNSKKFHLPTCSGANNMKAENREESTLSREELVSQGYEPCGTCKP